MRIPPGKSGQILIMGEDGEWVWIDGNAHRKHESLLRRFVIVISGTVIAMLLAAFLLCVFAHHARADDRLPGGWSCEQVRWFAASMGTGTVWDRERTRAIAAQYGVVLTEAQLNALEKCFT